MSIPIISPPSKIDSELARWLADFRMQVSGAFQNQEAEIEMLRKRIEELETP